MPFRELMAKQRVHDDEYHPDIAGLPLSDRAHHFGAHWLKYCGRLAEIQSGEYRNGTIEATLGKAYVDTFLSCMAAAWPLNIDLDARMATYFGTSQPTLQDYSLAQPPNITSAKELALWTLLEFSLAAGKFGKALDADDHKEKYAIRETWENSLAEIIGLVLKGAGALYRIDESFNVEGSVLHRLKEIEEKRVY
jgi:hypothetical protein